MSRAWLVLIVLAGTLGTAWSARAADWHEDELIERLPAEVRGAFSFENAADLRTSGVGRAITAWMAEYNALERTRRAWTLFAQRLGVSEAEAFDGLLGGSAVLAFAHREAQLEPDWIVLAAVDNAMDVRMVRRTRAVPRRNVYGRSVLGLEEESFLLAILPPLPDGRSVMALAPSGAEWLLVRTLAVSAGRADGLAHDALHGAPTDAVVRGFWKPNGNEPSRRALAFEPWLWGPEEAMHDLSIWAVARGREIEIGLSPMGTQSAAAPKPDAATEGVLLDVVGPGEAIVQGVLEPAGLIGLVPEALAVSRDTGELVVRQGPTGVDLGARLPITLESASHTGDGQAANARVVRVRDLAETPGSRAIFGPRPEMASTLLRLQPLRPELVVAVTAGPEWSEAVPPKPDPAPLDPQEAATGDRAARQPQAVAIVLEAADRPSPHSAGLHGSARPYALWKLLRSTVVPESAGAGPGIASLAGLVERARWAIETSAGKAHGKIVLELRQPEPR